jgi:hypothetical protein
MPVECDALGGHSRFCCNVAPIRAIAPHRSVLIINLAINALHALCAVKAGNFEVPGTRHQRNLCMRTDAIHWEH